MVNVWLILWLICPTPAEAPAPAPYTTFFGLATPPTSYGGYGGNAKEDAKWVDSRTVIAASFS